jgi:glutaredoxin 2
MHIGFVASFSRPARVILDPLPRIYVYDHCPYCVRVRLAFGLKNIKHEVRFLANDDIPTPTTLVGKKVVPIFELVQDKLIQPESLDIIAKIDKDPRFGPTDYFKPLSKRKDIADWQAKVADTMRIFQRPRYMKAFFPEFQQQDGKDAFVLNHHIPPFTSADWKAKLSQAERWSKYEEAYTLSNTMINQVGEYLQELDSMVYSEKYATEGGLSLDDIDLWARLRSVTLIKGVKWPTKLRKYMDNLSKEGDVLLYDMMAL